MIANFFQSLSAHGVAYLLIGGQATAMLFATGPALAQDHVYWGDVHGHTRISDGKGSLDDYFACARDVAGLDFVIVTDHDFGNAAPWRMPTNQWTLAQDKADQYTVNDRFVAIAGYEWTSQPKYWTDVGQGVISERLFPGPPRFYNHKNVYFLSRVDYLFSAKDPACISPDLLAEAVQKQGGLIHNNHPDAGPEGRDQFDYAASNSTVIANTEMLPDTMRYHGTNYHLNGERTLRAFLNQGGRTGFVGGSDTHEGTSAARTAVLARELTRAAIFDALRHRRSYAITHARIVLDFRINGRVMGEEMEIEGAPQLLVDVKGTDRIKEVLIIRDGKVLRSARPKTENLHLGHVDRSFAGASYYYVRVTQADKDEHGNLSQAWSSPIWVKKKQPASK
jgi:hypothetical protein